MADLLLDYGKRHITIQSVVHHMGMAKRMYGIHFKASTLAVLSICPLQTSFINITLKKLANSIFCIMLVIPLARMEYVSIWLPYAALSFGYYPFLLQLALELIH